MDRKIEPEKADVLLINPQVDYEGLFGNVGRAIQRYEPLNLLYLAAYLEKQGIPVRIYDGQVERLTKEHLIQTLKRLEPRVVGITCSTPLVGATLQIAAWTKEYSADIKVILGGAHPTAFPRELLENDSIDAVAVGEAEFTLYEFVEAVKGGRKFHPINGIVFKENGRIQKNPVRPLLVELDQLPFPAMHLIPVESYMPALDQYHRYPSFSMSTSRGCPYQCIFCAGRLISGFKYRARSAENVLEEMTLLVERYNAKNIFFMDDHFIFNRERTEQICNLLIREGLHKRVTWICAARVDRVSEDILKTMYRAGCRMICYGIETGSQRLMDLLKKKIDLEKVVEAVGMTRRARIKSRGTFILGIPTETREESFQTIAFAKKIGVDFAKFNLITPYPGTELFDYCRDQGFDFSQAWANFIPAIGFSDQEPIFIPEGRTAGELKEIQRRATREFYLRPRQIANMFRNIHSFDDLKRYLAIAKAVLLPSSRKKAGPEAAVFPEARDLEGKS